MTTPAGWLVWRMSRARLMALQNVWRMLANISGVIEEDTCTCQTIVWRAGESEQIDLACWLCHDHLARVSDRDLE